LVKKPFLTGLNDGQTCPANSADGRALTFLVAGFILVFDWPEVCSAPGEKVSLR